MPNSANSAIAAYRPYSFACTAQPPPTAASVATAANVAAMPTSIGSPLLTNARSDRANTKGSTGKMQELDDGEHAAKISQKEQRHVG